MSLVTRYTAAHIAESSFEGEGELYVRAADFYLEVERAEKGKAHDETKIAALTAQRDAARAALAEATAAKREPHYYIARDGRECSDAFDIRLTHDGRGNSAVLFARCFNFDDAARLCNTLNRESEPRGGYQPQGPRREKVNPPPRQP